MILITGANGELGSATINYLMDDRPDAEVAGLVRSEAKGAEIKEKGVEPRIGDYRDYDSLIEAFEDVDTLLFISSSGLEGRVNQHQNVINAAQEAGVGQIFYTSILKADKELGPIAVDHHKTEKLIKNSEIPYTIFRHTFYTEFLPMYWENGLKTGEWYFSTGGNKLNFALREEMAEALANALQEPESHSNKTYEITSAKAYTFKELAETLSEETGKEITYHDLSVSDFKAQLEKAGLPEHALQLTVGSAETFVNGGLSFTDDALADLLGRKPVDTKTFIRDSVGS